MEKANPKLKKFLEDNPELTVMGLFWAGYWRFFVIIFGSLFMLGLSISMFE